MIYIPILSDAKILGWPKHETHRPMDVAQYYPLSDMLTTPFECNAHFAQYSHPGINRRLDKGVFAHFPVQMVLFVIDVDHPGAHRGEGETPQEWRDAERAKVERLFKWQPGFYYETKKGYRLLYRYDYTISHEGNNTVWVLSYAKRLCLIAARYDISGDVSCSNWGRLFRTPRATRPEETTPEDRPTLGDPENVGVWTGEDISDLDCLSICDRYNKDRNKESWWYGIQRLFRPEGAKSFYPPEIPFPEESTGENSETPWKANPLPPSPRTSATGGSLVISLYRSYGLPALQAECADLARVPAPGRTKLLGEVCLRLFALVKSGALNREEVEQGIATASNHNGYIRDYGEQDLRRQLQNFWGMATPRNLNHVGKEKDTPAKVDPDIAFYKLTDTGNAERLTARHGKNLRHLTEGGLWYVWDETRWAQDRTAEVVRLAKDTIRAIPNEAKNTDKEDIQKKILEWAHKSEGADRRRAMISLAATDGEGLQIIPEQIDADPWRLTCLSGTLELETGTHREHRREDLHTKTVCVPYDPHATCPTWMTFLHRAMGGKPQLVSFLQRALGYSLTGETREHCLFFLYGSGNNGKTTFIETMRYLFGDYSTKADFSTFLTKQNEGPRNDIARLRGARLVAASEAEGGKRLAEALVKEITGGDTISARFLHQEFFEFKPQFKIWLAANDKPIIKGTDPGIWRRIRLVPFTVKIPDEEIDKSLPDKLKAELPGIFAWIVEGCLQWQKMGLGEPKEVTQATQEYREEMDVLADFIAQKCRLGPTESISSRVLYRGYKAWAIEQGTEAVSETSFGRSLNGRGITAQRERSGMVRQGICLQDHPSQSGLEV